MAAAGRKAFGSQLPSGGIRGAGGVGRPGGVGGAGGVGGGRIHRPGGVGGAWRCRRGVGGVEGGAGGAGGVGGVGGVGGAGGGHVPGAGGGGINNSGNVNINRNTNINGGGDWNGGWNGYIDHPIAAGIAVGAVAGMTAAAIGSYYYALPYGSLLAVSTAGCWLLHYSVRRVAYYEPRYEGDTIVYVTIPDPATTKAGGENARPIGASEAAPATTAPPP